MSEKVVLTTHELTKRYASTLALHRLNLTVYEGEIFGYLGPNGAGKTTTIRLLLDLIRPTSGSATIMGLDVHRQSVATRHFVGNLPGELRLWEHLTGWQVIRYLSDLRPGCDPRYGLELAERLDLNPNVYVRDYSTGMKRKLGIVQALMHKPPLLILDEPTLGLDPLVRQTFNEMILEIRDEGRTVFLSSHVLSEVQQVCDRVAILRAGVLQAVKRIVDLKRLNYRWVTIRTQTATEAAEWAVLEGVSEVEIQPGQVRLRVSGSLDPVIKLAARYPVDDLMVEEPSLEDFFLTFYDGARLHL